MANIDVAALTEQVKDRSRFVNELVEEVSKVVVGQQSMVERILMALLCDGHILLEGLPGLAKTLTIKTIADAVNVNFQRVQFVQKRTRQQQLKVYVKGNQLRYHF